MIWLCVTQYAGNLVLVKIHFKSVIKSVILNIRFSFFHRNMQAALDTIEKMKETGFFLNFYGLEQLLRSFAKLGDIESINKTLEMFEESKVELVNRDILNVIVELAVNGHTEHIDKFLNRLQPNMELKRSLDNAIAIFVEKGQAKIVPKILASPQIDAVAKASKLIEEMVQKSSSADELNEVLKSLEAIDITLKNNLNVFKSALAGQSNDLIRAILNEMKANSLEITENSFAKLIKLESERSIEGVLDVLRSMINEFNIQPQISFIADVVLPAINAKENPLLALAKLKTINNNPPRFVIAAMVNCLNENDLQNAYKIGKNNPMFYDIDMIKRPLINAFVGSNDVKTFVQLVRLIYDSIIRVNTYKKKEDNSEFNDIEIQNHKQKFIDQILFQAISSSLESSKVLLLQAFVDEGFTISNEGAEKIKKTLKSSQIPEIGPLIENLCSGDLTLRPIENRRNQGEISLLNSSEVQNILEIKIAQGGSAAVTEKHLLYAYLREENLTEIETLLGRSKFSVSNSDYAQVIELYVKKGKLDPALSMLRRVRDNNKKFQLDAIKTARLISLMVNNNRDFSEIETILVNNSQGKAEHRIFVFERLLERLATDGNVDMVNKLYNALVKNCYIEPSIELIGYLVSVHLQRGDIDNAVAAYEKIVNEMNMTPMHMVVLNHLIRNDKIEQLQHVFDLYEKVHGQENALFRLAFAFVECGKDRQARLIFEHDQVKNISRQIYSRCKNFVQFNRLDAAKVLLKATEGIYCNRHVIYESILDIYIKQNEAEEALKLGKSYVADEDVIPKETFLNKLSTLLTKNNVKVPFAVKSKDEKKEDISQESAANGL